MAKERLSKLQKMLITFIVKYKELKSQYEKNIIPISNFSGDALKYLVRTSETKKGVLISNKKSLEAQSKDFDRINLSLMLEAINREINGLERILKDRTLRIESKEKIDELKKVIKKSKSMRTRIYKSLKNLEEKKIIEKKDPKDWTYKKIKLTKKGEDIYNSFLLK